MFPIKGVSGNRNTSGAALQCCLLASMLLRPACASFFFPACPYNSKWSIGNKVSKLERRISAGHFYSG